MVVAALVVASASASRPLSTSRVHNFPIPCASSDFYQYDPAPVVACGSVFRVNFHGDNTGSNPVGDAKINSMTYKNVEGSWRLLARLFTPKARLLEDKPCSWLFTVLSESPRSTRDRYQCRWRPNRGQGPRVGEFELVGNSSISESTNSGA